MCYEDLRRVDGLQYDCYRDVCNALGLLKNDKEYVNGIVESSHWVSKHA